MNDRAMSKIFLSVLFVIGSWHVIMVVYDFLMFFLFGSFNCPHSTIMCLMCLTHFK